MKTFEWRRKSRRKIFLILALAFFIASSRADPLPEAEAEAEADPDPDPQHPDEYSYGEDDYNYNEDYGDEYYGEYGVDGAPEEQVRPTKMACFLLYTLKLEVLEVLN